MFAIVGLSLANEILDKTYNPEFPIGGFVIVGTYTSLEVAKEEVRILNLQSKKSHLSFEYSVMRLGKVHMFYVGGIDGKTKSEAQENTKPIKREKIDLTLVESLAESFSTYLHSVGVKKSSTNFLLQAEESISKRRQEVIDALIKDQSLIGELKEHYEKVLKSGPQLEMRLRMLDDLDKDGLPKCLNNLVM